MCGNAKTVDELSDFLHFIILVLRSVFAPILLCISWTLRSLLTPLLHLPYVVRFNDNFWFSTCCGEFSLTKDCDEKEKHEKKFVRKNKMIIPLPQFFTAQSAKYLSRKVEGNGPAKPWQPPLIHLY